MTLISACGSVLSNLVVRRIGVFRWWSIFWGRSMFLGVGIRVKYHRKVDLDPSRTYVFASNHQNALDIPIAAIAVPCPFGYVAKAALERVPVLGLAIRFSPSVIVDQSHPRRSLASMQRAGRQIRQGLSVIIFPEGKRSYQRDLLPFKKGAFLLAMEAGVPIVPVTIVDAYRLFHEKRRLARPGIIHVVVGEPISLEGMTRRDIPELMDRLAREIQSELDNTPRE